MIRGFGFLQKAESAVDFWKPKSLRKKPDPFSIYRPRRMLEFNEDNVLPVYKYRHPPLRTLWNFSKWAGPTGLSWAGLVTNPYPCTVQVESIKSL